MNKKGQAVSFAIFALLYSQNNFSKDNKVQGLKVRDIFDAYDEESKKEALNKDDTIDAAALSKEIGGDQIVKEVNEGSADDENLVQLNADLNIDNHQSIQYDYENDMSRQSLAGNSKDQEYNFHQGLSRQFNPREYSNFATERSENEAMNQIYQMQDQREKQHNVILGEIYFDQQNSKSQNSEIKQKVNIDEMNEKQVLAQSPWLESVKAIEASEFMQKEQQKTYVFGKSASNFQATLNEEEPRHEKSSEPANKIQALAQRPYLDSIEAIEQSQKIQKNSADSGVFGEGVSDIYNTLNGDKPGHGKEYQSTEPVTKIQILSQRPWLDSIEAIEQSQKIQKDQADTGVFGEGVSDIYNTLNGEKPGHGKLPSFTEPTFEQKILTQLEQEVKPQDPNKNVFGAAEDINNTQHGKMNGWEKQPDYPQPKSLKSSQKSNVNLIQVNQDQLENLIKIIKSPEDLEISLVQWPRWQRGGEKIVEIPAEERDKFYIPPVYGPATDVHNTRHGNLPGHYPHGYLESLTEPKDHYTIIQAEWTRK